MLYGTGCYVSVKFMTVDIGPAVKTWKSLDRQISDGADDSVTM
jgi:hypothetical protein